MKKIIVCVSVVCMLSTMTSCKKCSSCTAPDDVERVSEFCGNGRTYADQLKVYEKAGWTCTKK